MFSCYGLGSSEQRQRCAFTDVGFDERASISSGFGLPLFIHPNRDSAI